jgi:hypothetical protein
MKLKTSDGGPFTAPSKMHFQEAAQSLYMEQADTQF